MSKCQYSIMCSREAEFFFESKNNGYLYAACKECSANLDGGTWWKEISKEYYEQCLVLKQVLDV